MAAETPTKPAAWSKTGLKRWDRSDGAVVKYDRTVEYDTAKPWLPNHRGYIAFGPGKSETNYLFLTRRNTRMKIPRKFKTAESAMAAVDEAYPP